jgi:predicted dehydrogenase
MSKKINWGIIGTGNIAGKMAEALTLLKNAKLKAVLSRTQDKADEFARRFKVEHAISNRREFADLDELDVVYIASPHTAHLDDTLLCLNSGKAVLCEKPMALNANQVKQMITVAKEKKLFLMEAMWSSFFPAIQKTCDLIADGKIGDIRHIEARFCFKGTGDASGRHLNPKLGGGALLDVGIYTIYFANLIMNEMPVETASLARIGETGVDEESSYLLKYRNGAIATLSSGLLTDTEHWGIIYGTKGYIKLDTFWQPDKCTLYRAGKKKTYKFKRFGNAYTYEALHVMQHLQSGSTESDILPLKNSFLTAEMMDKFRASWNFKCPIE